MKLAIIVTSLALTACAGPNNFNRMLNGVGTCEMPITREVDPVCKSIVANGGKAVPAPKRDWSAKDRCTHIDSYGDNTDFYCVPLSRRTNPQPFEPGFSSMQTTTTTVSTPSGIYTLRTSSSGSSTQGQFYRYGGKR